MAFQNEKTPEAVALATNQFEDIVESLLGHAKDVGGVLKNRKITVQGNDKTGGKLVHREEELGAPPGFENIQPRPRNGSAGKGAVRDEPTVPSDRCVASVKLESGPEFTQSKKNMPFEFAVTETSDADWYYLKATVLKDNGDVLFVVETEVNGDRLRNTRINGKPVVPSSPGRELHSDDQAQTHVDACDDWRNVAASGVFPLLHLPEKALLRVLSFLNTKDRFRSRICTKIAQAEADGTFHGVDMLISKTNTNESTENENEDAYEVVLGMYDVGAAIATLSKLRNTHFRSITFNSFRNTDSNCFNVIKFLKPLRTNNLHLFIETSCQVGGDKIVTTANIEEWITDISIFDLYCKDMLLTGKMLYRIYMGMVKDALPLVQLCLSGIAPEAVRYFINRLGITYHEAKYAFISRRKDVKVFMDAGYPIGRSGMDIDDEDGGDSFYDTSLSHVYILIGRIKIGVRKWIMRGDDCGEANDLSIEKFNDDGSVPARMMNGPSFQASMNDLYMDGYEMMRVIYKGPAEDMWHFVRIGAPFPEIALVRAHGQNNMYVARWYKGGKAIHGCAWKEAGAVECAFPYFESPPGRGVEILLYNNKHHHKLGYWYMWIKYSQRFAGEDREVVCNGDSMPLLWADRAQGALLGYMNCKTGMARFACKEVDRDGVEMDNASGQLDNMLILVREFVGGPEDCKCEACEDVKPVPDGRNACGYGRHFFH